MIIEELHLEGFWPNPRLNKFDIHNNSPPWEVPRKRKSRGGKRHFFDLCNGELFNYYDGEIATTNRFKILEEDPNLKPMENKDSVNFVGLLDRNKRQNLGRNDPKNMSVINDVHYGKTFDSNKQLNNSLNVKLIKLCKGYSLDLINLNDPIISQSNNQNKHNVVCIGHVTEVKNKYNVEYF